MVGAQLPGVRSDLRHRQMSTCSADAPARHGDLCPRHQKIAQTAKKELDAAVRAISLAPGIGDEKVGALPGVCVYNFRLSGQLCLLAYRILDQESIKL